MNNTILIIIASILFLLLLISLFFLFRKNKTQQTNFTRSKDDDSITSSEVDNQFEIEKFEKVVSEVQAKIEIEKLEEEKQINIQKDEIPDLPAKPIVNIAAKTEKQLLKKLEQFEKSENYLNKDITLNTLSKQFNTNTKYLSEIIKSYKNKNFNQYINELRINNLIQKLENDDKVLNTKVSYLANDFGFNSHSTFSTLFTQYIGKSPSDYIKELKASKKTK